MGMGTKLMGMISIPTGMSFPWTTLDLYKLFEPTNEARNRIHRCVG